MSVTFAAVADWIGTFALHSTCAASVALGVCLALRERAIGLQLQLLRAVTWAPLLTASVQQALVGTALPLALPPAAPGSAADRLAAALAALDDLTRPVSGAVGGSPMPLPVPWDLLIVAAAIAAALLGCLRLGLGRLRLWRLLRSRVPQSDARVLAVAAGVAQALGCRQSPQLSCSEALAAPIAFGWLRPEVCLPARAAGLGDGSLRAMLAHEVAHLRVGDPAWMWCGALVQALFPWQPLFVPIRRRWARLAELRCDAIAASQSSPAAVARCLLDIAEWLRPPVPQLALGMAARPSALRERVEAVLRGRGVPQVGLARSCTLGGVSLSALTFLAPGVHTGAVDSLPRTAALQPSASASPVAELPPSATPSAPRRPRGALRAAVAELAAEHARLVAEVDRLRADLAPLPPSPKRERAFELLAQRLAVLGRLRARLEASVADRAPDPIR